MVLQLVDNTHLSNWCRAQSSSKATVPETCKQPLNLLRKSMPNRSQTFPSYLFYFGCIPDLQVATHSLFPLVDVSFFFFATKFPPLLPYFLPFVVLSKDFRCCVNPRDAFTNERRFWEGHQFFKAAIGCLSCIAWLDSIAPSAPSLVLESLTCLAD